MGGCDEWTKRLSDATTKTHHQFERKGTEVKGVGKGVYNTAQAWQLVQISFFFNVWNSLTPPPSQWDTKLSGGEESFSPNALFCN